MTRILIVTGSARPHSINQLVVGKVREILASRPEVETEVADLAALELPFFDAPLPPSAPEFAIADPRVQRWSDMVKAADRVLFVMPEYNHNMSAIQKNALDWLCAEWKDKRVGQVAYGWTGGSRALQGFAMSNEFLKMDLVAPAAQLAFMETLQPDGTVLDEAGMTARLSATIDALLA